MNAPPFTIYDHLLHTAEHGHQRAQERALAVLAVVVAPEEPEPAPVPVRLVETENERIYADQCRSRGAFVEARKGRVYRSRTR